MPAFDADQLRRDNPLSEYLPTRGVGLSPDGAEFRACCPFHAERTPSFTVYQGRKRTQEFHCFGCGEKGDVIDFVKRYDGVEFADACEILGGTRTTDPARVPASTSIERVDIYAAWKARMPGPETPPIEAGKRTPPLANPKRPEKPFTHYTPTAVYPYHHSDGRVIGYVLRVDIRGKKLTPLILWCENTETGELTWCHRPFAAPRRLYNLPAFAAMPDAQVLVVEGEKCAEAGKRILPKAVVTTWQGGGKAAGKSDWRPVSGRDVLIWPDADPEGLEAAHEAASLAQAAGASRVRIITPPSDKPKGWDIADAEAEGWTRADVVAFARAEAREAGDTHETPAPEPQPPEDERQRFDEPTPERGGEHDDGPATRPALKPVEQEKPQPEPESKPEARRRPPLSVVAGTDVERHRSRDIIPDVEALKEFDAHGKMKPKSITNFAVMLQYHRDMIGVFSYNEFSNQIVIGRRPPWNRTPGEWTARDMQDDDATRARMWLERAGLNASQSEAHVAIDTAARALTFNPIRDYFNSLAWDGVPRLYGDETRAGWLETYMGVKPTANGIERAFGLRFLVGIVARNLSDNPDGEKMDTMLVLEGPQGMFKSTAVKRLASVAGGVYFTDGINDLVSDDAKLSMQGALIVEADEGLALKRGHADEIKGALSKTVDNIRAPYGRKHAKIRRRWGIVTTLNPQGQGYLRDPTGARRFWPALVVRPADLAAIERDRDQLWAEAVAHYHAGEQWHLTEDEVPFADIEQKKRYRQDPLAGRIDEYLETLASTVMIVTVSQIFSCLGIPTFRYDTELFDRVVNHLLVRGWTKTNDKRNPRADMFKRPA